MGRVFKHVTKTVSDSRMNDTKEEAVLCKWSFRCVKTSWHPVYRKCLRISIIRTFSTKILTSKLGVCIICGYICICVGMLKNTTCVV